jgi:hypothetical protein
MDNTILYVPGCKTKKNLFISFIYINIFPRHYYRFASPRASSYSCVTHCCPHTRNTMRRDPMSVRRCNDFVVVQHHHRVYTKLRSRTAGSRERCFPAVQSVCVCPPRSHVLSHYYCCCCKNLYYREFYMCTHNVSSCLTRVQKIITRCRYCAPWVPWGGRKGRWLVPLFIRFRFSPLSRTHSSPRCDHYVFLLRRNPKKRERYNFRISERIVWSHIAAIALQRTFFYNSIPVKILLLCPALRINDGKYSLDGGSGL